jgi:hypothetical protein
VGVVCSGTSTWAARPPRSLAAEAYAAIKTKYVDQPNFFSIIVETGGYINRQAHLFLDTLPGIPPRRRLPDPGALQGPSPQDAALRGVMQARLVYKPTCSQTFAHMGAMHVLVRFQAYMFACIVVTIPLWV